jgi:putative nucleotidyltransferase with HDIG domain
MDGIDEIPPFRDVALRVLDLAQDPEASAADLARAISRDPALTSTLLRAANSSAYGGREYVSGLPEAVVRLGLRTVRDLAVVDCLPVSRKPDAGIVQRQIWMHAVASALCVRALGVLLRGPDPELDFLAGLFHDVGRFHLNATFPQFYQRLWEANLSTAGWIQAERAAFGCDHMEVGEAILTRWDFLPDLRDAAGRHHADPSSLKGSALRVAAGDELVPCPLPPDPTAIEIGRTTGGEGACALLGLSEVQLEQLAQKVEAAVTKEMQVFTAIH